MLSGESRVVPAILIPLNDVFRIFALYGRQRNIAIFLIAMLAIFLGVMVAVPILAFDCQPIFLLASTSC